MKNEFKKRFYSSIILFPIILFIIIKGSYYFYFLLFSSLFISCYEWNSMTKNKLYNLIGLLFLLGSFYTFYKFRINSDNNYWNLLIIILICILTDIGGYIFGRILKGPKLIKLSPNKTYSGAIGSFFLTLSSIPFFISYDLVKGNEIFFTVLFFLLISAISQTGDIIISYFKRLSNIKDTGKIIPGHGGLLDRIDGMIFAIPCAYIFLSLGYFNNILT